PANSVFIAFFALFSLSLSHKTHTHVVLYYYVVEISLVHSGPSTPRGPTKRHRFILQRTRYSLNTFPSPNLLLLHGRRRSLQPYPHPKISAYYQTRARHTAVVTSDWLAQAQAAVGHIPTTLRRPNPAPRFSLGFRESFCVINEFNNWRKQPDLAEAVAAIRALAAVIRASEATTMMELEIELKKASDSLKSWDTTSISLTAGCDLFMRYVTRTSALEYEDFNSARSRLIERAEKFGEISCKARRIIAMLSQDFIFDGCTILVHGFSRVVLEVLKTAAQNKKLFRVFCTEGRPDRTGLRLSNELAKLDVPVKLLIDSAVAYTMDEVDMVFVGQMEWWKVEVLLT
ncbi:translation initiation factor eif-2b subunit alpha, partial [Quercus suber]